MRGDDIQQGAMFSYLAPEQRVPANRPLRPIRKMVDRGVEAPVGALRSHVCRGRTALDCSRKAAACFGPAVPLIGAQRAPVDGTARLQPAVPLVYPHLAHQLHRRPKRVHPQRQFLHLQIVHSLHRRGRMVALPTHQLAQLGPVRLLDGALWRRGHGTQPMVSFVNVASVDCIIFSIYNDL